MVHLPDVGHLPTGQSLDQPELPQRTVTVEGDLHQAVEDVRELRATPWLGDAGAAQVGIEVELMLLDPGRSPEPQRRRHHSPMQRWDRGDRPGGPVAKARHRDGRRPSGLGDASGIQTGWIQEQHLERVHGLGRRFHVQLKQVIAS